ncbi:MAG: DNA translocase FtsK 4TM domain-containing protein, partial [Nitrospinae bacterium]|nr:DNA translocase FtsK 4TM domain-containing protein [Nitrospinota bacterium]
MNEAPKGKVATEVVGVLALAATALTVISLYSYEANDPSFNSYLSSGGSVGNAAGIVGAWLADLLVQGVGALAWGLPLFLVGAGVALVRGGVRLGKAALNLFGLSSLLLAGGGLLHIGFESDPLFGVPVAGGGLGAFVADRLT